MDFVKAQAERERIAEDILTEKQLILDLDRRRNSNREALGCFRKKQFEPDQRVWYNMGGIFMKMEQDTAKGLIAKDGETLTKEIESLRDSIKSHTADLEQLERGSTKRIKGFDLKGMQAKDLYGIIDHS
ncbi:uncharacterized protein BJ171DRAFT_251931 [Polychytrium aggregatum]|uniref:uncharacterized protein n=1 Tax=Polychytrium aggregatum TaxID=110093 RepID=UPI0022FEE6E4|nr:uncharacterized protein BJ171DRAFT_251931 [Polychytrium aggregatum]KAI9193607.1 hypothetical protein BJ171DRAFT_251931 [Polychytrium aggregatum]